MGDVIVELLPLVVGATVVPLYLIVVLFLLQGRGGLHWFSGVWSSYNGVTGLIG